MCKVVPRAICVAIVSPSTQAGVPSRRSDGTPACVKNLQQVVATKVRYRVHIKHGFQAHAYI
jgi:hypothetical protein